MRGWWIGMGKRWEEREGGMRVVVVVVGDPLLLGTEGGLGMF